MMETVLTLLVLIAFVLPINVIHILVLKVGGIVPTKQGVLMVFIHLMVLKCWHTRVTYVILSTGVQIKC
jgi:hypothetical protein